MNPSFAQRTRSFNSSAVRDILKVVNQKGTISFAGGMPDESMFPLEAMRRAFDRVFSGERRALQYGLTEGFIGLRERLSERMAAESIQAGPDRILLTTGSQQAIDLFARVMFDPGDVVLTENPTYLAAVQVFGFHQVQIVPVGSDAEGMLPDHLAELLARHKPKAVYTVPTFSNPTGKVWSAARRKVIVELMEGRDAVLLEDDPYSEIRFSGTEKPPSLTSLGGADQVVYTSTFSKTVVPALRTGWVTGPEPIIKMMAQAKQAADLHSSSIDQQALAVLMEDFDLQAHIEALRAEYERRMRMMLERLRQASVPGMKFDVPRGGMFFWVALDEAIDTAVLLAKAVGRGVAYVPGAPFYVADVRRNTLRLNFTHSPPEVIDRGMALLMETFEEASALGPGVIQGRREG